MRKLVILPNTLTKQNDLWLPDPCWQVVESV